MSSHLNQRNGILTFGLLFLLFFSMFGRYAVVTPGQTGTDSIQVLTPNLDTNFLSDGAKTTIYRVTLITGDIVLVTVSPDGRKSFAVQPVDPKGQFLSFMQGNDTYIIPSSARLNKLDLTLFNVDYLLNEKYYQLAYLPVLVSSDSIAAAQSLAAGRAVQGFVTHIFKIVPVFAARAKVLEVRSLYQTLIGKAEVKKIWLDRLNHANLNESVPLIGAPSVWAAGYDGTGIKIAILDTGIDSTHPDVSGKIVSAVDFTDDGTTDDLFGHGTHVAVIAAGTGAASGGKFKGVAPGATLMNVKVLNQYGWGFNSWIISGIEYATANGANIISMSLGGGPTDGNDSLSLAVDAAVANGVVASVAAGNSGDYFTVSTPGAARKAITVGASDKSDTLAWFSSLGPTVDFRVKPDVLAPGVNIISGCASHGIFSFIPNPQGQPYSGPPNYPPYYTSLSGTSMATPHVSGLIALIKQKNPTWTPAFIKDVLINTAVQLNGYDIYRQGGGRVYAPDAVQTTMLMDPGSYSFGALSATLSSAYSDFAIYNFGGSVITVLLSIALVDVQTGLSYSSAVTLNVTTLSVPNGSSKGVRLTVNLASLPTSVYSGLIYATQAIGYTVGKTIHSVFGFAKLWPVAVRKLNRQGSPAEGDWSFAFKTSASSWFDLILNYRSDFTDANGAITFLLADGNYAFTSFDWDELGMTIVENVGICSQTILTLDERNNMRISFDPALSNQQIASVKFYLSFEVPYGGGNILFNDFLCLSSRYPSSSDMYIGVTSAHALFYYQYFPASAYNPTDPTLIDAPSWGDLQYYSHGVSSPMLFVADYGQVVQRVSQYSLKLSSSRRANVLLWPKNKDWVDGQLARGRWFWFDVSWSWDMTFPQRRTEFLSPNTYYYQWVDSYVPSTGYYEWGFVSPLPIWNPDVRETWFGRVWRPGESFEEIWNGVLSSELNLYVYSPDYVRMFGSVFIDGYLHHFRDSTRPTAGSLILKKGDTTLFSSSLSDFYDLDSVPISGFGTYNVSIQGTQSQSLSTETRANFTLNIGSDGPLLPPVLEFRSDQINVNNSATGFPVRIDLKVETSSSVVTDVSLQYSMDDGASWTPVQAVATADPRLFIADLPVSTSGYVSLWANARDGNGNAVSQIVRRAFYETPSRLTLDSKTDTGGRTWASGTYLLAAAVNDSWSSGPTGDQYTASTGFTPTAEHLTLSLSPGDELLLIATSQLWNDNPAIGSSICISRDGARISGDMFAVGASPSHRHLATAIAVDSPGAGTYTYTLDFKTDPGGRAWASGTYLLAVKISRSWSSGPTGDQSTSSTGFAPTAERLDLCVRHGDSFLLITTSQLWNDNPAIGSSVCISCEGTRISGDMFAVGATWTHRHLATAIAVWEA